YLREPVGDPDMARTLAERVSARFLRYLEVLQPALEDDDDDADYEVEVFVDDDPDDIGVTGSAAGPIAGGEGRSDRHTADAPEGRAGRGEGRRSSDDAPPDRVIAGTDADRRELLMAAARRLVVPEDPTAISYVLSGLIQVELPSRQRLLEAATTELRLRRLEGLLGREIDLLNRDLKPLVIDARGAVGRLN
ncbi:MAG TPA: hypothetical protein VMT36_06740, partial [Candidatus Saccharimonadia bacterium]|nr:hypothetical protein [Candidatus Saccharimonadia bacterium]